MMRFQHAELLDRARSANDLPDLLADVLPRFRMGLFDVVG